MDFLSWMNDILFGKNKFTILFLIFQVNFHWEGRSYGSN